MALPAALGSPTGLCGNDPSRRSLAEFEYKLAGLLSARLRAERRRRPKLNLRFKLTSNVIKADRACDLVLKLKWVEDGKQQNLTYFVHAKRENTDKPVTIHELRSKHSHFSLIKCYQQYKNLKTKMQETIADDTKRKSRYQDPLDCRFVFYSTREVSRCNSASKASSSLLFAFEDIFDTGKGSVFSFGERDEEVWCLPEGEDKALFRKDFLPRLRVFCGQASASAMDALLTTSITDAIGSPIPREQRVVESLLTSLRLWWRRGDGSKLSESSTELDKVIQEDLMNNTNATLLDFENGYCENIARILKSYRTIYVSVPGVTSKVRCSKIRQVLEDNFTYHKTYSRRYLILSESSFNEYPQDLLQSLCENYCGILVINLNNYSDKIMSFVLNIIDIVKQLIVVSSMFVPKVRKFLRKHGRKYKEWEDPWTLNQLSLNMQEKSFRRRIVFQGYEMALSDLESAWPAAREGICGATLEALICGENVTIGEALPPEEEKYIPRRLQHRSELRADVFDHCSQDDYFLLSGFPVDLLERLRSPNSRWEEHQLMEANSTEEQPKESNCDVYFRRKDNTTSKTKWSVWGKQSSPQKLAEKLRENVHWLAYEGSTIIWKHTYGDSQVLGRYIDRQSLNCQSTFICSHDDIDDFMNWNNPTILLSGDVGTGKSAFITRMAHRIKERKKTHWVVLLRVNQGQMIGDLPSNMKLEDVIGLLEKSMQCERVLESEVTKHFLRDCLEKSGSIAILVDVVAEICPSHMAKVQRVLALLQESRAQYLCVAATTSSDSALKRVLKCSPSALQPFSAEDQYSYLMTVWGKGLEGKNRTELEKQVRSLVEAMSRITDYEGRSLCEVPLYTGMLAASYNGAEREKLLRMCIADVQVKICLLALYRKFVQESRKYFRPREDTPVHKNKNNRVYSTEEDLFDKLKSYAAYLCFNDRKLLGQYYKTCRKSVSEIMNNYNPEIKGLMGKRADGSPTFLHHTFGEFFAALWCVDHYQSLPNLTRALYTDRYARVRSFFDALLAEGHALHEAALSGCQEAVVAALHHGLSVNSCDRGGRRALHLAAGCGHREIVAILLAEGSNAACRDSVLRWTPLRYADNSLSLGAAEELLRAGGDPHGTKRILREFSCGMITYGDIINGDMEQILHLLTQPRNSRCSSPCSRRHLELPSELWEEAAVAGSTHVGEILINSGIDINRRSTSGMIALHVTAFCGNQDFTRLLLKHGTNINAIDNSGETALHKAVRCGHVSICEELLQFEANASLQDTLGRTALYQSVIGNEGKCLWETLLDRNVDINVQTVDGTTALLAAARFGNETACRRLLERGADANLSDTRGMRPLHAASRTGNETICRLLLRADAEVNVRDATGRTALHHAAFSSQKSVRICRLLIEFGADINLRDSTGATALHLSVTARNQWMSRTLFRYKPDINSCNAQRRTVLHEAVGAMGDDVGLILSLGADVNRQDVQGTAPLHHAAALGNEDICRLLLDRGADVRAFSKTEGSPLHAAAKSGNLWICRLLIEKGADVCCKDTKGTSVLQVAARHGHDAVCCLLLQQGADPKTRDAHGRSALMDAAKHGHETVCRMLLEFGADVHCRDAGGQTALHESAGRGHDGICHLLSMSGANVNVRDDAGQSPLHLAAQNDHASTCRLLMSEGADARLKDFEGTSALVKAAMNGHGEVCRLLLESGADVQAADWEGTTPLHAASKHGYEEVCRLLLEHQPDINAKDLKSRSSIDYAENEEIYKLLKKRNKKRGSIGKWVGKSSYTVLLIKLCPWLDLPEAEKQQNDNR